MMTHGGRYQPRTVFAGSVSVQFAAVHCAEQVAALAKVSTITLFPSQSLTFAFSPTTIFQVISCQSKTVWKKTSIELLAEGHPSNDHVIISGKFIAVVVFKHHSGMIPGAQATDGIAYAVIIPDQSFASFAALASKVRFTHSICNRHSVVICGQVPLQQHLSDDRLLYLRSSRVTITPDAVNPIGYNVDGQSIPPVTLQITAGLERVDFVTNASAPTAK